MKSALELRMEALRLRHERDTALRALQQVSAPTPARGRCVYCGATALGQTCRAHSDLPQLDPLVKVA